MKAIDFKGHKPEKYFEPSSSTKEQVLISPEKYSNYIATKKMDGEWCRLIYGEKESLAQSRSVSKKTGTYGDKTEFIPHIWQEIREILPQETVLIGELCFLEPNKTSKDVGSILRCLVPKALARQKETPLYFVAFDCLMLGGQYLGEMPYQARLKKLQELNFGKYFLCTTIYPMETIEEEVTKLWEEGYEGMVLHNKTRLYAPGTRPSAGSIKLKKELGNYKCLVTNVLEPNKLYTGTSPETHAFEIDGELVTKPYYYGWKSGIVIDFDSKEVSVASGLTDKDREWLATPVAAEAIKSQKLFATITGMSITESGSIRHPQLIKLEIEN